MRAIHRNTLRKAAAVLERQATEVALRMPVGEAGVLQLHADAPAEDKAQHGECVDLARRLRALAKR